MAVSDVVGRRYGRALFDVARRRNDVDRQRRAVEHAAEALSSDGVTAILLNPRVSMDDRQRVVEALVGDSTQEVRNTVRLLVERTRVQALPVVAAEFGRLADALSGVVRAEVTAAIPVDAALERRIAAALGERLGGEVQTSVRTDPSILGGLVIRVGDRVIDSSLRTRLEQLQAQLV